MKTPSQRTSSVRHIVCPLCESGELASVGPGVTRCGSCGLPLLGSALETLREIVGLPDALGAHPCECGHPEMRELPYRVLHCPACGSEVLPMQSASGVEKARLGSLWSAAGRTSRRAGGAALHEIDGNGR
jgi:DNA-directed RNA polymerase subunit RPC12/RpoP